MLGAWIDRLQREPALLAAWRRALPPIKSADQHSIEIEAVYDEVLARRNATR